MFGEISKPKPKLVRLNIMLDQETDNKLRMLAIKYNTTKSEIIRFALREVLPELEKKAKMMEA